MREENRRFGAKRRLLTGKARFSWSLKLPKKKLQRCAGLKKTHFSPGECAHTSAAGGTTVLARVSARISVRVFGMCGAADFHSG